MSLVKYRLKEVAADFGVAPKEIVEIVSKFFEKPKSNTQVLTEEELNADYIIPAAFDERVGPAVAKAVAEAARKTGVARI